METSIIGVRKEDLDTPALLVELDRMERNISRVARFFGDLGVQWRPHSKGHKSPAVAHRQLAAGAVGITCAKLGEAEVMAAAGVKGIMIANQVVGEIKLRRLAALARGWPVIVSVDSEDNARQMARMARDTGAAIGVVVEVDTGSQRAGVQPGAPAVQLSRTVDQLEGLRYLGVMGWEGHVRKLLEPGPRKEATEKAVGLLVETARLARKEGLEVEIVSCGGTGTEEYSSRVPGVTENQSGGIIFNDVFYSNLGIDTEVALTVISSVTSRPDPARVITDAGKKTLSTDTAQPRPIGMDPVGLRFSAEHGVIDLQEASDLAVGDRVEWMVGYGDTTVNLHDEMYGLREGRVECVWPVSARGRIR